MNLLDKSDYALLNKLQENPFNIRQIAREIGLSYYRARRRIIRLVTEEKIVKVCGIPIYPKLGLTMVVFILDKLLDTDLDMKVEYGRNKIRLLGGLTLLTYTIPNEFIGDLVEFIKTLYGDDSIVFHRAYDNMVIEKKDFYLLDDYSYLDNLVNLSVLDDDVYREQYTRQYLDEIDLFIVKELEKNAIINITSIARKLRISKQLVRYHMKHHVLARELVKFTVKVFRDMNEYPIWYFSIDFADPLSAAIFAKRIARLPYITSVYISNSSIITSGLHMSTPLAMKFMKILDHLIENDIVTGYRYYIQNPSKLAVKYTIPYKMYKNGKWKQSRILQMIKKGKVET